MQNKHLLIFMVLLHVLLGRSLTDNNFEFSGELVGNFTLQIEENQPAIQSIIERLNELMNETDSDLIKQLETKIDEQNEIIERQQVAIDELQKKQSLMEGKLNPGSQNGTWIQTCTNITTGAILGGHFRGLPSYVAKINSGTWVYPGRVSTDNKKIYYTHNGREYTATCYEILVGGRYKWEQSSYGAEVPGAMKVDPKGLYIGRTYYKDSLLIGKVDSRAGYKGLYVSYNNAEYKLTQYEILVDDTLFV